MGITNKMENNDSDQNNTRQINLIKFNLLGLPVRVIVTIITTLIIICLSYYLFQKQAEQNISNWFSVSEECRNNSGKDGNNNSGTDRNKDADTAKKTIHERIDVIHERIDEQSKYINDNMCNSWEKIKFFYINNYASSCLVLLLGGISSICLFFISKQGWQQAHKVVISIFLTTSTMALLLFQFSQTFKYNDNFKDSLYLYVEYSILEQKIENFLTTNKFYKKNSSNPLSELEEEKLVFYIHGELEKLAKAKDLAISFDQTNMRDLINRIKLSDQITPSSQEETPKKGKNAEL